MRYKIVTAEYVNATIMANQLRFFLKNHTEVDSDYEFLLIIGGDGTFAKQVRLHAFVPNLKIIGIHGGRVGFFSSFNENNLSTILEAINSAKHSSNCFKKFHLIELTYQVTKHYAFNDLILFAESMLECSISLNNDFYESYRGSGLLISTKYGSSGYNKSASGPLIFPEVQAWLLTELFPQSTSSIQSVKNSLVLPLDATIQIDVANEWTRSRISLDGLEICDNKGAKSLQLQLIESQALIFLPCCTRDYVKKIREIFLPITNKQT